MPKDASTFELILDSRPEGATLTRWLHQELRRAILDGRIRPGTRLPATRDFAKQYGVSRGTAVTAFDQLLSDGYLRCQVGSGTWVNELLPRAILSREEAPRRITEPSGAFTRTRVSRPRAAIPCSRTCNR